MKLLVFFEPLKEGEGVLQMLLLRISELQMPPLAI